MRTRKRKREREREREKEREREREREIERERGNCESEKYQNIPPPPLGFIVIVGSQLFVYTIILLSIRKVI